MAPRNYSLDLLRSMMMLLGIVLHGIGTASPVIPLLSIEQSDKVFSLLLLTIHTFRMPVFFWLSGYLSALLFQKLGTKAFLHNRLKRLAIPFFLAYLSINTLSKYFYQINDLRSKGMALNDAIDNVNGSFMENIVYDYSFLGHLWFLYLLVIYILTVGLFEFLFRKFITIRERNSKVFVVLTINRIVLLVQILASVLAAILFFSGNHDSPTPTTAFINFEHYFIYLFYFAVGWLFYSVKVELSSFARWSVLLLAAAIVFNVLRLLLWTAPGSIQFFAMNYMYALSVWFFCFGLIGLFQLIKIKKDALMYLSDASYWVYLIHYPIILMLKGFVLNGNSLMECLMLLLFTTFFSFLSYHYLVRPTFVGKLLNGKIYPVTSFYSQLSRKVSRTPQS